MNSSDFPKRQFAGCASVREGQVNARHHHSVRLCNYRLMQQGSERAARKKQAVFNPRRLVEGLEEAAVVMSSLCHQFLTKPLTSAPPPVWKQRLQLQVLWPPPALLTRAYVWFYVWYPRLHVHGRCWEVNLRPRLKSCRLQRVFFRDRLNSDHLPCPC